MGQSWKYWATVFFLLTNGDHKIENPTLMEEIKDLLRGLEGNVDTVFQQDGDHIGIDRAGLEPGAFYLKFLTAYLPKVGLGHLTAGAVVGTNEEYFVHRRFL